MCCHCFSLVRKVIVVNKGQTNAWIESFLSNRTQSVVVEGTAFDRVPVLSGILQGSVLGPCLFLLYINDIADGLTSTTRLFADDTMIYMAVKSRAAAQILQQDLQKLERWDDDGVPPQQMRDHQYFQKEKSHHLPLTSTHCTATNWSTSR